jgi:hypothetical protein
MPGGQGYLSIGDGNRFFLVDIGTSYHTFSWSILRDASTTREPGWQAPRARVRVQGELKKNPQSLGYGVQKRWHVT